MNIGDKAPEILGTDEKGEEIRLSAYKGKKIVLLPGQLITGRKSIAKKFKIDESKVQRIL